MEELRERLVRWGDENLYANENPEWVADAILAAIQETHHVVPKDRERWEKLEGSGEGLVMCPVCESWTI
jgi:hypothetical protein